MELPQVRGVIEIESVDLVVRVDLTSAAQQRVFVARLGAEVAQALAKMNDAHRGWRGENKSEFEINCEEAERILTQASIRYAARSKPLQVFRRFGST